MEITTVIGENVRGFRKLRGWTQARLGAQCELNGNYIGNIERGEYQITVATLQRIAKSLKQPLHYFLVKNAFNKTPEEIERALKKVQST